MSSAVGIDVSKGKSTASILQPGSAVTKKSLSVVHSSRSLNDLSRFTLHSDGQARVVMECTDRYHEPILHVLHGTGIFVSAVNPHLIKSFGNNSIHKVKSDPAGSRKIARHALDNWASLRQYSDMDTTRTRLRTPSSQMDFLTKQKVTTWTDLTLLMDMTYPDMNSLFSSPAYDDGSEKWLDYIEPSWHMDCVRKIGLRAFTECYQAFCRRNGHNFQLGEPKELCLISKELVAVYPRGKVYKDPIMTGIEQLRSTTRYVGHIRHEMDVLASILLEYEAVLPMRGVGKMLGPQLMAGIDDITSYTHREALIASAGVGPGVNESGSFRFKNNLAPKCGSSRLRKALFLIITSLLQASPVDDRAYRFLDRKRSGGKSYLAYITAGANKLLWICCSEIRACITSQGKTE